MATVGNSFYSAWGMVNQADEFKIDKTPRKCPERGCYGTVYYNGDYWKCDTCRESWIECPTDNKI